jgi:phenylpyruvate tautomerase PptA (4-oxalocrotonate tautomerase family)
MQEYNLEIKPSKIIKGQGLAKMLTTSNREAIEMGDKEQINVVVSEIEDDEWYSDII